MRSGRADHLDVGYAVFHIGLAYIGKAVALVKVFQVRLRANADGLGAPLLLQCAHGFRHQHMAQATATRALARDHAANAGLVKRNVLGKAAHIGHQLRGSVHQARAQG